MEDVFIDYAELFSAVIGTQRETAKCGSGKSPIESVETFSFWCCSLA